MRQEPYVVVILKPWFLFFVIVSRLEYCVKKLKIFDTYMYNIMFNICKDKCFNKITILAKYYIYTSRCKVDYIT